MKLRYLIVAILLYVFWGILHDAFIELDRDYLPNPCKINADSSDCIDFEREQAEAGFITLGGKTK